jgi:hypothetical protein
LGHLHTTINPAAFVLPYALCFVSHQGCQCHEGRRFPSPLLCLAPYVVERTMPCPWRHNNTPLPSGITVTSGFPRRFFPGANPHKLYLRVSAHQCRHIVGYVTAHQGFEGFPPQRSEVEVMAAGIQSSVTFHRYAPRFLGHSHYYLRAHRSCLSTENSLGTWDGTRRVVGQSNSSAHSTITDPLSELRFFSGRSRPIDLDDVLK